MHHLMAKFWWILVFRGILGILLGLASFAWGMGMEGSYPNLLGLSFMLRSAATLASVILFLGLYALVDGSFSILLGSQDYGDGRRWWTLLAEGILSVALGLLTWLWPTTTALVVLYGIAFWAILTGFLEYLQGLDLNEYKERRRPFMCAGLCSMAFGLAVLFFPTGGIVLVYLIGVFAFLSGIPLLWLGLRLRPFVLVHHSR